jgi:hypothetical protein
LFISLNLLSIVLVAIMVVLAIAYKKKIK